MTQEALKLALDLAIMHHSDDGYAELRLKVKRLAKEALAQPEQLMSDRINYGMSVTQGGKRIDPMSIYKEPEQEPVAVKHMKAWVEYLKRKSDHGQHMKIPSEMSAGACWELAIELEQFINTTPPQRTWVGLTDEELLEIYGWRKAPMLSDFIVEEAKQELLGALRKVEAKLKEKNCL